QSRNGRSGTRVPETSPILASVQAAKMTTSPQVVDPGIAPGQGMMGTRRRAWLTHVLGVRVAGSGKEGAQGWRIGFLEARCDRLRSGLLVRPGGDAARTPKPQWSILLAAVNLAPGRVAVLCSTTPMSTLVPRCASNIRQYPAAMVNPVLTPSAPA